MSRIFFVVDGNGVDCLIYSEGGRVLAKHRMTLEGARVRHSDFNAAIEEAAWNRDLSETLQALGVAE